MPQKRKYDRNAIYLEYLTSDEDSIDWFLKASGVVKPNWKGGFIINGWHRAATAWRQQKKYEFKERAMQKAVKQLEKEMGEKVYKPTIKELSDMHKKLLMTTKVALNQMTVVDKNTKEIKINPLYSKISKEIKDLREIVKVEKKEPTKYVEDLTPPAETELSERQMELLKQWNERKKKK